MKICILGGDGYLGWPTAMHFSSRGHDVLVVDNCVKRRLEGELGVIPLEEVPDFELRAARWHAVTGKLIRVVRGDIYKETELMERVCSMFRPDTIIHYAEQPSAPYSMMDRDAAVFTQANNVIGNLNVMFAIRDYAPEAHLVKLGTMGEYGTPNIDIEEGWIEIHHKGRRDRVLYPKRPASLYHCSKVHDSVNLEFACRSWNIRVTDLNQGVVYGIETNEMQYDPEGLRTSFHYDDIFGTVLNRFVVQAAIGMPLTVYGEGGQTRGYLNLKDTLQCVELATLKPALPGEFRVFNQFTEQFSVLDLARRVQRVAARRDIEVTIASVPNPRVEMETHYYRAANTALRDLGLRPHLLNDDVIDGMLDRAILSARNVREKTILPRVTWKLGSVAMPVPEPTAIIGEIAREERVAV
jgi:UDP-sulfoquinovose synthase